MVSCSHWVIMRQWVTLVKAPTKGSLWYEYRLSGLDIRVSNINGLVCRKSPPNSVRNDLNQLAEYVPRLLEIHLVRNPLAPARKRLYHQFLIGLPSL